MKKIMLLALVALMTLTAKAQDYYQVREAEYSEYSSTLNRWDSIEENQNPRNMIVSVTDEVITISSEMKQIFRIYKTFDRKFGSDYYWYTVMAIDQDKKQV